MKAIKKQKIISKEKKRERVKGQNYSIEDISLTDIVRTQTLDCNPEEISLVSWVHMVYGFYGARGIKPPVDTNLQMALGYKLYLSPKEMFHNSVMFLYRLLLPLVNNKQESYTTRCYITIENCTFEGSNIVTDTIYFKRKKRSKEGFEVLYTLIIQNTGGIITYSVVNKVHKTKIMLSIDQTIRYLAFSLATERWYA